MGVCVVVVAVVCEWENGCTHIGSNTDVDEVMTKNTNALSLCGVCHGQLQSLL